MIDIRVSSEDEVTTNRDVANMMIVVGVLLLSSLVLNYVGYYHVESYKMYLGIISSIGLIIFIQFIGRIPKYSFKHTTKYTIIGLIVIICWICIVLFNFHVILILLLPLIAAMNYHSKKLVFVAFLGSIFCATTGPVISNLLGYWDTSYFVFLVQCADKSLIDGNMTEFIMDGDFEKHRYISTFITLPLVCEVAFYGYAIYKSIVRKQSTYNYQVNQLNRAQDRIILGLADVIENRDTSTGGHVRRTSDVVKILIEKLKEDGTYSNIVNDEFCENVIKGAPMHDLGKIAIEDAILTKAGRLTPEEFDKIKQHPKKSYDIISSIMVGVANQSFLNTSLNLALYHHEKWNGTGYPSGLRGDDIPLEARIMAIADVYDALVSKRCYKESVASEAAYIIIKDSMGSHFDPKLWNCFDKAYPELIEYYKNH